LNCCWAALGDGGLGGVDWRRVRFDRVTSILWPLKGGAGGCCLGDRDGESLRERCVGAGGARWHVAVAVVVRVGEWLWAGLGKGGTRVCARTVFGVSKDGCHNTLVSPSSPCSLPTCPTAWPVSSQRLGRLERPPVAPTGRGSHSSSRHAMCQEWILPVAA
jgi:hypothetical protein